MAVEPKELIDIPFFQGFAGDFIQAIAEHAVHKKYRDGEEVTDEGSAATEFYLILSGGVSILSEKWGSYDDSKEQLSVPIQTLSAGQVLGWSWVDKPQTWTFSSTSKGVSELLCIDARMLLTYFEENPKVGYQFLKRLIHVMRNRISATRMNLALYSGKPFAQVEGG